jgi:hypothetical protein
MVIGIVLRGIIQQYLVAGTLFPLTQSSLQSHPDGFTAQLTPDGSHLDSRYYPYDLMNTRLAPGVRKLPSALNLQILQTIWQGQGRQVGQAEILQSPLRATPLIGISNGDFSQPAAPDWDARGSAQLKWSYSFFNV